MNGNHTQNTPDNRKPKKRKIPDGIIVILAIVGFFLINSFVGMIRESINPSLADDKATVVESTVTNEEAEQKEAETEDRELGDTVEDVVFIPAEVVEEEPIEEETPEIEEEPTPEVPAETAPLVEEAPEPTPPVETSPIVEDPIYSDYTDTPTYQEPVYQEPVYQEPVYQEPVVENTNSATVYMTNTGSKYHIAGCRHLSDSCIAVTLDYALSIGLTPCGTCH